jgi:hypothetical protein
VEKISEFVNSTLTYVKQNMTWVAAKEIEGVQNLTSNFEEWYLNVTTMQSTKPLTETPAYHVRDVRVRLQRMRDEAVRLTKIRKIDPMPYRDGYGGYGGSGGYGGYGGYDDPKMREFYRQMYENMSRNGSNSSDFFRGYGSNYSNFSGFNNSDYMRSFYEHMARNAQYGSNFSSDKSANDTQGDAPTPPEGDAPAPADEGEKADHSEL